MVTFWGVILVYVSVILLLVIEHRATLHLCDVSSHNKNVHTTEIEDNTLNDSIVKFVEFYHKNKKVFEIEELEPGAFVERYKVTDTLHNVKYNICVDNLHKRVYCPCVGFRLTSKDKSYLYEMIVKSIDDRVERFNRIKGQRAHRKFAKMYSGE